MTKSAWAAAAVAFSMVLAACSGVDDDAGEERGDATAPNTTLAGTSDAADTTASVEPETESGASGDPTASIEGLLAAQPVPSVVDPDAEHECDRYGYLCSPFRATPEQLDRAIEALQTAREAIQGVDDAREQLRLGLLELTRIEGVGHVRADSDTATMFSFTVDGGPVVSVFTEAGLLREDGEVAPVDETFELGPEVVGFARPRGFSGRSFPDRYEPAGGPTNRARTALIINPYNWPSASAIGGIFRGEDEYAIVDELKGAEVNPFQLDAAQLYDAVHILTHGGGSCPSWTDDRDECSSTFIGGPIDTDLLAQVSEGEDSTIFPETGYTMCTGKGDELRWCTHSDAFPTNPNGIVFFGSCGSDFGFNNGNAGASVGWTGTSQRAVVERTAEAFWRLMVEEGVEFQLAAELVQGGGFDSHTATFWASRGAVNAFTSAAFAGRNLRARDAVEPKIAGELPRGQVVNFNGTPEDGEVETFPADDQEVTITLDGVRSGTEAGVQFEVRGNGVVWETDIDLVRDGTVLSSGNGYASWLVTLIPDAVKMPDVMWADLKPTAEPIDLEVRAFENASEYTAELGSIRLGTDVVASGTLPIFDDIAAQVASRGGSLDGNDLRVEFNTGGGDVAGELNVAITLAGMVAGRSDLTLEGAYDPETGDMEGTFVGQAVGTMGGGGFGEGTFTGRADLDAQRVDLIIEGDGPTQAYVGAFVS